MVARERLVLCVALTALHCSSRPAAPARSEQPAVAIPLVSAVAPGALAAKPQPAEEARDDRCPEPAESTPDDAQMWVEPGYSLAYAVMNDWRQSASGSAAAKKPSEAQARALICQALEAGDLDRLASPVGKHFKPSANARCDRRESVSFRGVDEQNGIGHVLPMGQGTFVMLYEAPHRYVIYPRVSFSLRAMGELAVQERAQSAWACPRQPNLDCAIGVAGVPDDGKMYCTQGGQACVPDGFSSDVLVMDPVSGHVVVFSYESQSKPTIAVEGTTITVTTDECHQEYRFDDAG